MLARLAKRWPEAIQNRSLHLPAGECDACYSGALHLADHSLGFLVSFLVPYYVLYEAHTVEDVETMPRRAPPPSDTVDVYLGNTMFVVRADAIHPEVMSELAAREQRLREEVFTGTMFAPKLDDLGRASRRVIGFEFSPDDQAYATVIAEDIEATFACQSMPPELGSIVVPDVATNARSLGEARLYDCLFSDDL
jgi:hypothetical protein